MPSDASGPRSMGYLSKLVHSGVMQYGKNGR
jgi:hypothetical protein